MIENLAISVPFDEVENSSIANYFQLFKIDGEFLIIQNSDSNFFFLCSDDCDMDAFCQAFDWYIANSK